MLQDFPPRRTKAGKERGGVHNNALCHVKSVTSQFFFYPCSISGASIDINCETNGDIDAMDCSWNDTELIKPEFKSR